MIQSSVAFFMLAALERMGERAEEVVPGFHVPSSPARGGVAGAGGGREEMSPATAYSAKTAALRRQRKLRNCAVSRKTIEQVLSSIFAFNDEIDADELKDLCSAIYGRLAAPT